MNSKTVSFFVSLSISSSTPGPGCCGCRGFARIPRVPMLPWPLFTGCMGPILRLISLCRPVLRAVPGLGRSVSRAAVVVCSGKLVHQPIEPGEADMCFWPQVPVYSRRSCSARFCRGVEPPLRNTCPLPGACSITRWFTGAQLFSWRQPFLPFHQPLAPAREVAHWHPAMQRRKRVRPDSNDRSVENSSPPLSTRARLARRLKSPVGWSPAHHCPRP